MVEAPRTAPSPQRINPTVSGWRRYRSGEPGIEINWGRHDSSFKDRTATRWSSSHAVDGDARPGRRQPKSLAYRSLTLKTEMENLDERETCYNTKPFMTGTCAEVGAESNKRRKPLQRRETVRIMLGVCNSARCPDVAQSNPRAPPSISHRTTIYHRLTTYADPTPTWTYEIHSPD